ncbi:MAG: gamma-glutamyl-gamma-aminobutyrate hydrolase family protein [Planctomycetota bacterium]
MEQEDSRRKATKKRAWPKRLRVAAVVGLCLVVVGYVSFRVWKWASVPRDAPVIGVSLDTAWHARVGITVTGYEVGLSRAGGRILELRPGGGEPEEILDRIDALLLAGGGDIDPELYGGAADDAQLVDPDRDRFELALIQGALEREMPILGICRGIQILNVSQGGTVRNLRDDAKLADAHGIELDSMDAHPVTIAAGSRLATLLGAGRRDVNSFHGQAVGRVAPGVVAAAESPDGVVEAIELSGPKFAVGIQWHPEMPPQQMAVLEAFLKEAKAYRARRGR